MRRVEGIGGNKKGSGIKKRKWNFPGPGGCGDSNCNVGLVQSSACIG